MKRNILQKNVRTVGSIARTICCAFIWIKERVFKDCYITPRRLFLNVWYSSMLSVFLEFLETSIRCWLIPCIQWRFPKFLTMTNFFWTKLPPRSRHFYIQIRIVKRVLKDPHYIFILVMRGEHQYSSKPFLQLHQRFMVRRQPRE